MNETVEATSRYSMKLHKGRFHLKKSFSRIYSLRRCFFFLDGESLAFSFPWGSGEGGGFQVFRGSDFLSGPVFNGVCLSVLSYSPSRRRNLTFCFLITLMARDGRCGGLFLQLGIIAAQTGKREDWKMTRCKEEIYICNC